MLLPRNHQPSLPLGFPHAEPELFDVEQFSGQGRFGPEDRRAAPERSGPQRSEDRTAPPRLSQGQ